MHKCKFNIRIDQIITRSVICYQKMLKNYTGHRYEWLHF